MSEAITPLRLRAAFAVLVATFLLTHAAQASASVDVDLRIEGSASTLFSGDVTTSARAVPGGSDRPECRADATPVQFSEPNSLTASADALGAEAVATSGGFYGWGTLLCGVNDEFPVDTNAGWMVRINQQDSTAPNGYVTATDPLSNRDSVLLYMTPSFGFYSSSLELRLPRSARPGETVIGYVDSFGTADDLKSAGVGAEVSGGGASATSRADGSFSISFPAPGKFLVTAEKKGAVRGSRWITVDQAALTAPPERPSQKQINRQRRIAARARCRASAAEEDFDLADCIRRANRIGSALLARERRIAARAKCVADHPQKRSAVRVACVRKANSIGR